MGTSQAIAVDAVHPAILRLQRRSVYLPTAAPVRRVPRTRADTFLTDATSALKLLAAALGGAAITLALWPNDSAPVAPSSAEQSRFEAAFSPDDQQSIVYSKAPTRVQRGSATDDAVDRSATTTFPVLVQTLRFTAPTRHTALQPLSNHVVSKTPLTGKPLRYLIGTDGTGQISDDEVTVVSYGATQPAKRGISIAYCNLFDERNTGHYGPYLHTSGTAKQYNEGQIDPHGPGWQRNLREQFERRKKQGFEYVELDNPDAYAVKDVIGAIELAASYGLKVIAKNPLLLDSGAATYVAHPNVHGIIVERGAGGADEHDALRRKAGKPNLPTWFVSFGGGRSWANGVASSAKQYRNMGVTYSSAGEYGNSIDILTPATPSRS
jgi:hypothetical protein